MSRLGQQMFSVRKRNANAASATGCFLRESVATAAGCWSRRRYHRT
ncbi:hypothetical protein [Lysinibacillus xylanilyticus]